MEVRGPVQRTKACLVSVTVAQARPLGSCCSSTSAWEADCLRGGCVRAAVGGWANGR